MGLRREARRRPGGSPRSILGPWRAILVGVALIVSSGTLEASGGHSERNWVLIEKVLIAEAASEGYDGLYAVACVMRNRGWKLDGFSGTERHDLDVFVANQPERTRQWAHHIRRVLQTGGLDRTGGATHYENVEDFGTPWWAKGQTPTVKIGRHTFWRIP